MPVITVQNLNKTFGNFQALRDFSIEIEAGQVIGLLGPNGAGKSTLIKTLVGGVRPTAGVVEVLGSNPLKNRRELSHRIGYMPQAACLYQDLSVKDNIRFFAKLHMKHVSDERIHELLDFLGMTEKADTQVQHLSGGMKTRISLACAMIHEPDILFLDEPTAGLDPALKRTLWDMFHDLTKEGKTLFISTHLMDEALLCDQLAIIRRGELLAKDTPRQIIEQGKTEVTVTTKQNGETSKTLPSNPGSLATFLHEYGLNKDVSQLQVTPESLEDITISIVEGREF